MKKAIKTILIMCGLICVSAALSGCSTTKINLNDYLETSFGGYDTVGTASYKLDIEGIIEDYPEAFGLDADDTDYMDQIEVLSDLDSSIKGELSKSADLTNGEEITFEWGKIKTEKLEEKYSVKFSYDDISITVEDLEEVKEFNPFDYVTVTYGGTAPNGTANIETKNAPIYFNVSADKTDGLKNGDIVTVSAGDMDDLKEKCITQGYVPTTNENTYTVEGLSAYASKVIEIPEDFQNKMKSQAEDSIKAYTSGWNEGNTLKNLEFAGYYFLSAKEGFTHRPTNQVYLVYKVTANMTGYLYEAEEETTGEDVFYTYYYFDDIMILPDGTCSADLAGGELCSKTCNSLYYKQGFFGYDEYTFKGYKELDSMFNACVTSNIEKYSYENTVA